MARVNTTGRTKQARPSRRRRIELYRQLDEMARAGDPHAAGWLLLLTEEPRRPAAHWPRAARRPTRT